jgi:hypothetical protein
MTRRICPERKPKKTHAKHTLHISLHPLFSLSHAALDRCPERTFLLYCKMDGAGKNVSKSE